jgi:hypothetical protein
MTHDHSFATVTENHTSTKGNDAQSESRPIIINLDDDTATYVEKNPSVRGSVVRDADKALKFRIAEHKALGMLEVLDAGGYDVSGLRLKANVEKETAKQRRQDDIDMARRDGERSVKKQIIAVVPAVALGAVYLLSCVYAGGVAVGTKAAVSTLGPVAKFFFKKGL